MGGSGWCLTWAAPPDVEQEGLRWEVTAQQVLILPSHPAGISCRTEAQFHFPVQTRPDVSRALSEPPLAWGRWQGRGGSSHGPIPAARDAVVHLPLEMCKADSPAAQ